MITVMRYPGGKGKVYQHIINLMPPHRVYIEAYLGGGAIMRHKKPAEHNLGIDIDPQVIARWQQESEDTCELLATDAVTFLQEFSYTGGELIYCDPPYYPDTRRRKQVYAYDYAVEDHFRLLSVLNTLPCLVMISGYDNATYNRMLAGWNKKTFLAKTHTDMREECLWFNFEPPNRLHDARYLGQSFRERQTIKRRQERLQERV